MANKYVYTEEMESRMQEVAADGVTEEKIVALCEEFEFPRRSVTAKLRKMDFEVPKKTTESVFSEDETEELRSFLESNDGEFTSVEVAEKVAGGKFTPKQISGKAMAMQLTANIKPAEKKVAVKTYTDEEEETVRSMATDGSYIEEIAESVGKTVASVRGKLLSMKLTAPTRDKKATSADAYAGIEDVAGEMSVVELAEKFGKTERGVKTVLSRRKIACADYTPKSLEASD